MSVIRSGLEKTARFLSSTKNVACWVLGPEQRRKVAQISAELSTAMRFKVLDSVFLLLWVCVSHLVGAVTELRSRNWVILGVVVR